MIWMYELFYSNDHEKSFLFQLNLSYSYHAIVFRALRKGEMYHLHLDNIKYNWTEGAILKQQ